MLALQIRKMVEVIPQNDVFSYRDLDIKDGSSPTIVRTLNRMVQRGELMRFMKGKYYKPRVTPFGKIQPREEDIIKTFLQKDGKTIGYITGYMLFLQMGLTTQVPNIVEIGINGRKNPIKKGTLNVRFSTQKNTIDSANVEYLKLLDCLKFIKKIPDTTIDKSVVILSNKIKSIDLDGLSLLISLSLAYQPRVRAMLGAIIEQYRPEADLSVLRSSLNPITTYRINVKVLETKSKWNIL